VACSVRCALRRIHTMRRRIGDRSAGGSVPIPSQLDRARTTFSTKIGSITTGRSSMALFTCTAKLDPGVHGARCARAMAVHHAVGISCQRNSGYRPSRVNIMAQGLSTSDPSLSPTHLSIRRSRATTTHYTHHQVSLMVSRNTTLVPSLGLCIGPACEAGLSVGMRRERVPPQRMKMKKMNSKTLYLQWPTNRKSYMVYRMAPFSVTLNNP